LPNLGTDTLSCPCLILVHHPPLASGFSLAPGQPHRSPQNRPSRSPLHFPRAGRLPGPLSLPKVCNIRPPPSINPSRGLNPPLSLESAHRRPCALFSLLPSTGVQPGGSSLTTKPVLAVPDLPPPPPARLLYERRHALLLTRACDLRRQRWASPLVESTPNRSATGSVGEECRDGRF
jgi:hypothetical protein